MKKITLAVFCMLLYAIGRAQCPVIGIFTRPGAAVNPQRPSMVNNFDWMRPKYLLNTTTVTPGNDSIWSPIYQPDNDIIDHLRLSLDMKPEDGWELLRRELGFNQNGTPANPKPENPYIVMYNKYSSVLRVFYARGSSAPFTAARITLKFADGSPAQSSLLDLSEGMIPLDSVFIRNKIFQSPSKFDNRLNQWFFADFPMQYDPCTCYYTSRLSISVQLINQASVALSGSANGQLMAINNGTGPVNQQDKTFSFADLVSGAKKAGKIFKDINKFKSDQEKAIDTMLKNNSAAATDKKQNLNLLQQALKGSSFLRAGLSAAPYIGAAVSLLDFFIGGGKKTPPAGPQEVKLTPTSIDMTIRLNGTITSNFDYGSVIFWNPGSNIAAYSDADYPYYNEIMGIFNLTETPRVNMKRVVERLGPTRDQLYTYTSIDYRIQNPIKYTVNPAARLVIQDAKVALVVEGDSSSYYGPAGDSWRMEGKDQRTGKWQYATDYEDVNCLNRVIWSIRGSTEPGNINWLPNGRTYLKFLINFRRTMDTANTQNVLFVAKYPVRIQNVSNIGTVANDPCTATLFIPATGTEINTLCNSQGYKNNRLRRIRGGEVANELETTISSLVLAPNPAHGQARLQMQTGTALRLNMYLTDATGRRVLNVVNNRQYPAGLITETIHTAKLASGVYNVVIEKGNSRLVKKLLVQHP